MPLCLLDRCKLVSMDNVGIAARADMPLRLAPSPKQAWLEMSRTANAAGKKQEGPAKEASDAKDAAQGQRKMAELSWILDLTQ